MSSDTEYIGGAPYIYLIIAAFSGKMGAGKQDQLTLVIVNWDAKTYVKSAYVLLLKEGVKEFKRVKRDAFICC